MKRYYGILKKALNDALKNGDFEAETEKAIFVILRAIENKEGIQ